MSWQIVTRRLGRAGGIKVESRRLGRAIAKPNIHTNTLEMLGFILQPNLHISRLVGRVGLN